MEQTIKKKYKDLFQHKEYRFLRFEDEFYPMLKDEFSHEQIARIAQKVIGGSK